MNGEMTAKRGQDAPAVAKIESDVATFMQAMRGEIYIDDTLSRCTASGDENVVRHFVSCITAGSDVAFEVAELIKAHERESGSATAKNVAPAGKNVKVTAAAAKRALKEAAEA